MSTNFILAMIKLLGNFPYGISCLFFQIVYRKSSSQNAVMWVNNVLGINRGVPYRHRFRLPSYLVIQW